MSQNPGWPAPVPVPIPQVPIPEAPATREESLPDELARRLFDRRVILVHAPLDDELATRVSAQLLTLDALSEEPITVRLSSPDGELGAALTLTDTIETLLAPVSVLATGRVGGPALLVLAAAAERRATAHASFRLRAPELRFDGRASDLTTLAAEQKRLMQIFIARLAEVTRQPLEQVESDVETGRFLSADEALDYGLLESVERGRG
jgi:ATP-dependent Clp protease protease subunit